MNEAEQLTELCQRLGATPAQARIMAGQLLKRAGQIAAERGLTREAALSHLLDILLKGHAGEMPKDFMPPGSRSNSGGQPPLPG